MLFSKIPFRRNIRKGHRYNLKQLFEQQQKQNYNSTIIPDTDIIEEGSPKTSQDRTGIDLDDFSQQ